MGNTPTAKPPLPFGGSTAEGPRDLFVDRSGTLFDPSSGGGGASVRDITNLVGARIRSLTVHEDLGIRRGQSAGTTAIANQVRQPWVLTCQSWIVAKEPKYIIARVNPKDVQWRMPQRSVIQKTRQGEILHVWKDRFRNTFYDEPTLSITFQSGNIMPIRSKPLIDGKDEQIIGRVDKSVADRVQRDVTSAVNTATGGLAGQAARDVRSGLGALNRSGSRPRTLPDFGDSNTITRKKLIPDPSEHVPVVPQGLDNFYEFIQLVDEQKILDGGDINFVYIIYNSRIFPNITLAGLFTPDGVSWTDTADDPNNITSWTANFTVYDSFPRLNDLTGLVNFFKSSGFGRI